MSRDQHPRGDDGGFTLVEVLMAMFLLSIIMGAFYFLFIAFAGSATNSSTYTQAQGTSYIALRDLEADLRSADPLVLVPTTFTADPNGLSNAGPNGTTPTDVVAMYENLDRFAPCTETTTPATVPSPFNVSALPYYGANVIWAYDPGPGPNAHTLTRYSLCGGVWTAGPSLANVHDAPGTMFTVSQDSAASQLPQATTPSPTTVPNQGAVVCGTSVKVSVIVEARNQATPYKLVVNIPLPNQGALEVYAC